MERRRGAVIRRELPPSVAADPAMQQRLGDNFIDVLAALHRVDYEACGLSDLGKPDGYLARQVEGWTKRWYAAETDDRAEAGDILAWLAANLPPQSDATIVHNDYKLDNTIGDDKEFVNFVAVLDWDMCTLGDPLCDLGNVLALWAEPGDPPAFANSIMPTAGPGFPRRRDVVERYALETGRDVAHVAGTDAFAVFRYAVINQQIYVRYRRGQTQDARFKTLGSAVSQLIEICRTLVSS